MTRASLNLGLVTVGLSWQIRPAPGFAVTLWTRRNLARLKRTKR